MNERRNRIEIETQKLGGLLVITPFINELTHKNTKAFLLTVKEELEDYVGDMALNMKQIQFIDSVSLGTLVAILKYVKARGGEMSITNVAPPIMELFHLLNFNSVFSIFDTVEDAAAGR